MPAAKISYQTKKIRYNFGSGFGFTKFNLKDNSFNKNYNRDYVNFFPEASLTYSYKPNHSLRFNYNGSNQQPSLNQLQPLRNSNDLFYQILGNPDLKPSFTNSFNLSNNAFNFLTGFYNWTSINIRSTKNAIINKQTVDAVSGKTVSQPVNTDGNFNIGLWSSSGKKFKKINIDSEFGPNINYGKNAVILNNKLSYSNTLRMGMSAKFSRSVDKKYELSIGDDFNYNQNKNAIISKTSRFNTNNIELSGALYYKKVWSLKSDYNFYSQQKTVPSGTGLSTQLWNASVQRTFKKNEFTVYLKVRDILNQNVGTNKYFYGNTYTETENERLKRYFLLGFKWDFMNKTTSNK
jgi:hypothetical protein